MLCSVFADLQPWCGGGGGQVVMLVSDLVKVLRDDGNCREDVREIILCNTGDW
jgi:hypothetical protein